MERAPEKVPRRTAPFLPFSGKKEIVDSSLRRPNFLNAFALSLGITFLKFYKSDHSVIFLPRLSQLVILTKSHRYRNQNKKPLHSQME